MIHKTCPDCGARVGEKHKDGCDVERCPHCGGQALGCVGFDQSDPRRQAWDAQWPGEADCERLGFFVDGDRRSPISTACSPSAAGTRNGNGGRSGPPAPRGRHGTDRVGDARRPFGLPSLGTTLLAMVSAMTR